jgi:hypothetical protein
MLALWIRDVFCSSLENPGASVINPAHCNPARSAAELWGFKKKAAPQCRFFYICKIQITNSNKTIR